MRQFDVKTAFLNGDIDRPILMMQPPGYHDGTNRVCSLRKALYGLKQAPAAWYRKMDNFLVSFGLAKSNFDRCVYTGKDIVLVLYVDDGLICGKDLDSVDRLLHAMSAAFDIKHGDVTCFLGMEIQRNRRERSLRLHQSAYVKTLLECFDMANCNPVKTPAEKGQQLTRPIAEEREQPNFPYRKVVGALMYLAIGTRPEIGYIVGMLSRYLDRPTIDHWSAAKRVLRYLAGSIGVGINFIRDSHLADVVRAYSDADCLTSRKSTSGVVIIMNQGPILWFSRKQTIVSTSTIEAEFVAAHDAAREIA